MIKMLWDLDVQVPDLVRSDHESFFAMNLLLGNGSPSMMVVPPRSLFDPPAAASASAAPRPKAVPLRPGQLEPLELALGRGCGSNGK